MVHSFGSIHLAVERNEAESNERGTKTIECLQGKTNVMNQNKKKKITNFRFVRTRAAYTHTEAHGKQNIYNQS